MKTKKVKGDSLLSACLALSLLALSLSLVSCGDPISSGPDSYSGFRVIFRQGEGQGTPPIRTPVPPGTIIYLPTQENMTHPTGKVLSGWNDGLKTYKPNEPYVVNRDVDFIAQWTAVSSNTYTVSFDPGEGSGAAPAPVTVAAGTTINLPSQGAMNAPHGKQFDGWRNGGVSYAAGNSYPVNGNVTFTAQWKDSSGITIDWDDGNGRPGLAFELINNNTAYRVSAGTATSGAVVIPAAYNGLPVTEIDSNAFRNTAITGVTIPSSVTSIGIQAFLECTSLTSVTIPSSVTSIGDLAFQECASLTGVTISPGVASIGMQAFSYCTSIASVTIPSSIRSIGGSAFFEWRSSQTINVMGFASRVAADAAWGANWRNGCGAVIKYWNGNEYQNQATYTTVW